MRKFDHENIEDILDRAGIYYFYNKQRKKIYIGRSRILRHRLFSYLNKDDYTEHPTKKALRNEIFYFSFKYMPISEAREKEMSEKKALKHNHY